MNYKLKIINNFFNNLLMIIINIYQKVISPVIPARCRYYPTCSNYGKHALAWHGLRAGGWLLLKRIGSCHPLGGQGVDFVPLPLASYCYQYVPIAVSSIISAHGIGVYPDHTSYVVRLNYLMSMSG